MTYGLLSHNTRIVIERRAKESNIPLEKLGLEPEWRTCESCNGDLNVECLVDNCDNGAIRPEFVREIAVISNGALDETFYLDDLYAVNVADWIAEKFRNSGNPNIEDWEVILTEPYYEDSTVIYRVSSFDSEM